MAKKKGAKKGGQKNSSKKQKKSKDELPVAKRSDLVIPRSYGPGETE